LSRKELIRQLKKENPKLKQIDIKNINNIISEFIFSSLKSRTNVEIKDLGRFYIKNLKENFNARNPATNELIYKPERARVRFKASKKLNKFINE